MSEPAREVIAGTLVREDAGLDAAWLEVDDAEAIFALEYGKADAILTALADAGCRIMCVDESGGPQYSVEEATNAH